MSAFPAPRPDPIAAARAEFPFLGRLTRGRPPAFLDSAASAQKPRVVLDAMREMAAERYANVHRGAYRLSAESTAAYEGARSTMADFIGAESEREIVFVRGTTEAINLVANTLGESFEAGDEIVLSDLEHHANLVPWQMLAKRRGLRLKFLRMDRQARLDPSALSKLLGSRVRLLALTHVSNAFGTRVPLEEMIAVAKDHGVPVLVDGAQAAPHLPLSMRDLGADFYAFSGHKMYGPTGVGVLWGKRERLEALPPWQGGGEMITEVLLEESRFREPPWRFEAGTPAIVEAVGLAAAAEWLSALPRVALRAHAHALVERAHEGLASVPGARLHGPEPSEKEAIVSFTLDGVHPHDLSTFLDQGEVSVRAGHHCAQPAMRALGLEATARASFGVYNDEGDVERLVSLAREAARFFGPR